jgi:hypothetical protein
MTYLASPAEQAWVDAAADPAAAAQFVPVAAAFNRMDTALLEPHLTDGCVYESQSALEGLRGKAAVLAYLDERFDAVRGGPGLLVTAELAADPGGRPCALLRQRASGYGRPGLGAVSGFFRITASGDGRIGRLLLVTSVPPPGLCKGAGLFPGLTAEQVRAAREFEGERIPLGPEVVFTLFAMPRVSACDEMVNALGELVAGYAPARARVVTPKQREVCIQHGVTGFPTLLIVRRGETVRALDGYHTNEQVREALADLFQP